MSFDRITTYRYGQFTRERAPAFITEAEEKAHTLIVSKREYAKLLDARLVTIGQCIDVYTPADQSAGHYVVLLTEQYLLDDVYIANRAELIPFLVDYALPIAAVVGEQPAHVQLPSRRRRSNAKLGDAA